MANPGAAPEIRHRLPDRLFHWVMAAAVVVLGATAFLPILGVRFEWVPIHWIAGVVLTLAVLFHLYRVFAVHGLGGMSPGADDLREVLRGAVGKDSSDLSPAKYDALQKGYHTATAMTVLALVGTGLVMLAKIDTSFWKRNPSIMTDQSWGVVYVVHGGAAMVLLFLFLLHLYFSLIPEHRAFLQSMIAGRGPGNARRKHQ
jgi:cytochrome b subunit of formate dehydrogenase